MTVVALMATDRNGVIGKGGKLPWHLPSDLKRFQWLTMGRPCIMGRKTFESIGKPLKGRTSIVLTSRPDAAYFAGHDPNSVMAVRSVDEAFAVAWRAESHRRYPTCYVIGGRDVYLATMRRWHALHLTLVDSEFEGDTSVPLDAIAEVGWAGYSTEFRPATSGDSHDYWTAYLQRADDPEEIGGFDLSEWVKSPAVMPWYDETRAEGDDAK